MKLELRQVDPGDLVEVDAGVDHPLEAGEAPIRDGDHRAGDALGQVGVRHRHELQRRRFEQVAVEAGHPHGRRTAARRVEPDRPAQAGEGPRRDRPARRWPRAPPVGAPACRPPPPPARHRRAGPRPGAPGACASRRRPARSARTARAPWRVRKRSRSREQRGAAAVEQHRRHRVQPVGEEARRFALLRLRREQPGVAAIGEGGGRQEGSRHVGPPQHLQRGDGRCLEHAEDDRRAPGIAGDAAGRRRDLLRAGDGMVGDGDAEALGAAPEAHRERPAEAVVAVDHRGPPPAERVVEVVGQRLADPALAEVQAEEPVRLVGGDVGRDDGEPGLARRSAPLRAPSC